MKSTHLPKLEGLSLKNWYVPQLHELMIKCLDGLSPRWNQTKTSFSYDHILTINSMGYVNKHTTIIFDSESDGFWWGKMLKNGVKTSKIIKLFILFVNICFGLFSNVFSLIEEDKRSTNSIKQRNNIT